MARILGVDLPRNKSMKIALRSLYGVGPKVALDVLEKANIDFNKSSNDVSEERIFSLRFLFLQNFKIFFKTWISALKNWSCSILNPS